MNYVYNGISLQNKRQSNMDSLLLKCREDKGRTALLAVICDGVGSLADGSVASGMAVKLLNEWFNSIALDDDHIGLRMRNEALKINAKIVLRAEKEGLNTATTLTALMVAEGNYFIVHAGDTRVYCCEEGKLTVLTKDDISDSGKLTECIGYGTDLFLQYYEGSARGKVFLVCSDGLYKRADTGALLLKIASWNKKPQAEPIEALARHVIECGEQDNITAALIRVES